MRIQKINFMQGKKTYWPPWSTSVPSITLSEAKLGNVKKKKLSQFFLSNVKLIIVWI